MSKISQISAVFASLTMVVSVQAQSFTYSSFSSTAGLQLNGNAAAAPGIVPSDGTVLRLTPATFSQAGTAFSTTEVSLLNNASFSTEFAFRMTVPNPYYGIYDGDGPGADGITFVVQDQANNVGGSGGGIGYQGITPSLGVEFDTWNNGFALGDENNGNHVATNTDGVLNDGNFTPIGTRMNNGDLWYAWVDYNGATNDLQVRLSDNNATRPTNALIDTTSYNLTSILGQDNAFVGFTAGTGSAYEAQDIVSWQFNDTYQPINSIGVPDEGVDALDAPDWICGGWRLLRDSRLAARCPGHARVKMGRLRPEKHGGRRSNIQGAHQLFPYKRDVDGMLRPLEELRVALEMGDLESVRGGGVVGHLGVGAHWWSVLRPQWPSGSSFPRGGSSPRKMAWAMSQYSLLVALQSSSRKVS